MKVVEDSPSRLVLRESGIRNQLGGILFAGMSIVVFGLALKEHRSLVAIGAGAFFALGIYMLVTAQSDTVTADRLARQLSLRFKSLHNRTGRSQTYSFADVAAVQLTQQYRQQYFAEGNGAAGSTLNVGGIGLAGNVQTFIETNVVVQLRNGTLLTIADEQKQAGLRVGTSSNTLMSVGQKLATVLGVPFQVVGATSPGSAAMSQTAMPGRAELVSTSPVQPSDDSSLSSPQASPNQSVTQTGSVTRSQRD